MYHICKRSRNIDYFKRWNSMCSKSCLPIHDYEAEPSYFNYCLPDQCVKQPYIQEPKIVIIGAGVAGLSAADRLVKRGITNFTILEALSRPGGRIHSCWMGDIIAELGAYWWTKERCASSPLYQFAVSEDLPAFTRRDSSRGMFVSGSGRTMEIPIMITAYNKYKQIEQEAANLYCHGGSKQHGSILSFIGARIQQEVREYDEKDQYDVARIMFGMANILRTRSGDDLSMVSVDCKGSYIELPGSHVRVPIGLSGFFAPFLRTIPDENIKYCMPVESIRWGTSQKKGYRAIVKCCNGAEFPADYVLSTMSLGCLKCYGYKIFCPALPAPKMEAIYAISYGYCNKIFFEYCRPFWCWHLGNLKFSFPNGLCNCCDWTRGICCIEPVPESSHVLCVWVTGHEAMWMEQLSDCDVAEGVTSVLRYFTGNYYIPYPVRILRTKWSIDPFFCGSYSYKNSNVNPYYHVDLAQPIPGPSEPVPPVLLFAGEATVPCHNGTIHGARLSGIREAERIITMTNMYKGPPLPKECDEVRKVHGKTAEDEEEEEEKDEKRKERKENK